MENRIIKDGGPHLNEGRDKGYGDVYSLILWNFREEVTTKMTQRRCDWSLAEKSPWKTKRNIELGAAREEGRSSSWVTIHLTLIPFYLFLLVSVFFTYYFNIITIKIKIKSWIKFMDIRMDRKILILRPIIKFLVDLRSCTKIAIGFIHELGLAPLLSHTLWIQLVPPDSSNFSFFIILVFF